MMVTKTDTDNAKLQADVEALRKDLAEVTKTLRKMGSDRANSVAQSAAERVREV